MPQHRWILVFLIGLFLLAGIFPLWILNWSITLEGFKEWQAWYAALAGFGGLVATAAYNASLDRAREDQRIRRRVSALGLTAAWEVYTAIERAHWSGELIGELITLAREGRRARDRGRDDDDDFLIQIHNEGRLAVYVPETIAIESLMSQIGDLGNLASELARYCSLLVVARRNVESALSTNEDGALDCRSLVSARGWTEAIVEKGLSLIVMMAGHFPEIADQIEALDEKARNIDEQNSTFPPPLTVDASEWTGRGE